jgi:hypothetical protein
MYANMHFLSRFLVNFVVDTGACGVGCKALLTLGNRGQVKRRVHARTHTRTHTRTRARTHARTCTHTPPQGFAPRAFNLPHYSSSQPLFLPLFLHIGIRQGLSALELGDLESVASPWGSS